MHSFKKDSASILNNVVPNDRGPLLSACAKAFEEGTPGNVLIQRKVADGNLLTLHAICSCVGTAGSDSALMFIAYRVVDNGETKASMCSVPWLPSIRMRNRCRRKAIR